MLELEDDTEVQAVFGTYDISLNVIGNGSASFEFTGPDEVELTVTKNKDKFRHFAVKGEKWANSEMKFSLHIFGAASCYSYANKAYQITLLDISRDQ